MRTLLLGLPLKQAEAILGEAGISPQVRGTARRRWKEFVTITGLRGIATIRCICICELHCCRLGNGESSSADDGTRSARPRGLGGNFDFSPLNPLGTP